MKRYKRYSLLDFNLLNEAAQNIDTKDVNRLTKFMREEDWALGKTKYWPSDAEKRNAISDWAFEVTNIISEKEGKDLGGGSSQIATATEQHVQKLFKCAKVTIDGMDTAGMTGGAPMYDQATMRPHLQKVACCIMEYAADLTSKGSKLADPLLRKYIQIAELGDPSKCKIKKPGPGPKKKGKGCPKSTIIKIQKEINKLLGNDADGRTFKIGVDGSWGKQTEAGYQKAMEVYFPFGHKKSWKKIARSKEIKDSGLRRGGKQFDPDNKITQISGEGYEPSCAGLLKFLEDLNGQTSVKREKFAAGGKTSHTKISGQTKKTSSILLNSFDGVANERITPSTAKKQAAKLDKHAGAGDKDKFVEAVNEFLIKPADRGELSMRKLKGALNQLMKTYYPGKDYKSAEFFADFTVKGERIDGGVDATPKKGALEESYGLSRGSLYRRRYRRY